MYVQFKEYVLRVQRGVCKDNSWLVLRRYNEFAVLHKELQISGIELPLPGKKIVGENLLFSSFSSFCSFFFFTCVVRN